MYISSNTVGDIEQLHPQFTSIHLLNYLKDLKLLYNNHLFKSLCLIYLFIEIIGVFVFVYMCNAVS